MRALAEMDAPENSQNTPNNPGSHSILRSRGRPRRQSQPAVNPQINHSVSCDNRHRRAQSGPVCLYKHSIAQTNICINLLNSHVLHIDHQNVQCVSDFSAMQFLHAGVEKVKISQLKNLNFIMSNDLSKSMYVSSYHIHLIRHSHWFILKQRIRHQRCGKHLRKAAGQKIK
jgi:hypothetical protein